MSAITERHVQAIWYDSSLRPKRIFTRNGCEVFVKSPGDWNLAAGPDFRNAVLEIGPERRRISGDVEVHLCPRDWDFHGHGTDPAYRNVIAHVTWNRGADPDSLPPDAVSIWIGRLMAAESSFSPDQIDLTAYPYARLPIAERPCGRWLACDSRTAHRLLADAGRRRLRMKANRILGRLCERAGQERQVFYEEVMTAFGYRRNSASFRRVSERVPVEALLAEPETARMALLVAGSFEVWNRRGIRPSNAPERRLANAADLFTRTAVLGFARSNDFSRQGCRAMIGEMCGGHLMGRGRAAAVLANVIVPFAMATGRLGEPPEWLPAEDISDPVRLAAFRLFGRDHNPSATYAANDLLVQGLIHIHRELCTRFHPDCNRCALSSKSEGAPLCFKSV